MSVIVWSEVWRRKFKSANRKIIALKLADCASHHGKGIWPSVRTMACQAHVSERSVHRILQEFIEDGLLTLVRKGGRGAGNTNLYEMNMTRLAELEYVDGMAPDDEDDSGGYPLPANKGDTVSPMNTDKGDTVADKGDTGDKEGCQGDTQTVKKTGNNRQRAHAREAGPGPGEVKVIEMGFKRFWRIWPNYMRDSERSAKAAWYELNDEERQAAIECAPAFHKVGAGSDDRKINAASVYLRDRLWIGLPKELAEHERPIELPAYGKAWNAWRLYLLGIGKRQAWSPKDWQHKMIADGKGHLFEEERRLAQFPDVREMDESAFLFRPFVLSAVARSQLPDTGEFAQVEVGSERWEEWKMFHVKHDWPWINPPKSVRYIWMPKEIPAQ